MGDNEIMENLVYLTENLTNLYVVLTYLLQEGIISRDENDEIMQSGNTGVERNEKLLAIIQKDWQGVRDRFIEILRQTNNEHCADEIEGKESQATDNEITRNLVYLAEHLTNLHDVLNHLEQDGTISTDERKEIENENTSSGKNTKLLFVIQKKDWHRARYRFLEILQQTNNEHCADKIDGKEIQVTDNEITKNIAYLAMRLTNLQGVLNHLQQDGTISKDEREKIENEKTSYLKNTKLLTVIHKKDWHKVRERFLEILRQTNNEHSADKIEGKESQANDNEITKNFVYLAMRLTNLHEVLNHLQQDWFISKNEREEIENEKTLNDKNTKLLTVIQNKNWHRVRDRFLEILRRTNNKRCADKIEGKAGQETGNKSKKWQNISNKSTNKRFQISNTGKCAKIHKWWPDEKLLIDTLHQRKYGHKLLVKELYARIQKDKNRTVVICESAGAAKYSGMGGMGKTLTAKWYAHHYEEHYDHILWIDCGEGSLLKSFKDLAMELEIRNWDKCVEVEQLATKCFESLFGFRCLWILDNAESYKGKEGIIKVLPNHPNFFCLITSRSREWGIKNSIFAKISNFKLGIFSQEESLEFLKKELDREIKSTQFDLNELCRVLGNLPLALQLAVKALNSSRMDVKTYIEKSMFVKELDKKFDDYERTINGNVKVSLDLIEKEKFGRTANEILMIFGYIQPDDIEFEFFKCALQIKDDSEVKESVQFLTKYSLVAKTKRINEKNEKRMLLSINRLLQLVIRHNGKEKEKEIVRKILGCEGFIDYKLLPFTKYAHEDLKKEFPKVKAQLLDQKQLKILMWEKRFDDCVQLSKFIDQELQKPTTKWNYAICLQKNGQLKEFVLVLEELYEKVQEAAFNLLQSNEDKMEQDLPDDIQYKDDCEIIQADGLLNLDTEVPRELVGGHLLLASFTMNNKEKTIEILEKRKQFKMTYSQENLDILIRLVHSELINLNNYSLYSNASFIALKLDVETKKIHLRRCTLSAPLLNTLSPEELVLSGVMFFRDGQELEDVKVNEFVDLSNIKRLTLHCFKNKRNLNIELSGDASLDTLQLKNMGVLNWNNCNWNIRQLYLSSIPFEEKNNMNLQQMTIYDSAANISCLPEEMEKLSLYRTKVYV